MSSKSASTTAETLSMEGLANLARLNWMLMLGASLITTLSLASVVFCLLSGSENSPWPWPGTESVFLIGLSVSMSLLGGYLTKKHLDVIALQKLNQISQRKSSERLQRHYDRLIGLLKVSRIMGAKPGLQTTLDGITQTCKESFDCQQVSIMLRKRSGGEMEVRSAAGHLQPCIIGSTQKLGHGIAGKVAEEGKPLLLGTNIDTSKFEDFQSKTDRISSSMVVPISLRDEVIGVLSVTSRVSGHSYDQKDLHALQVFAEIAAICIRHTQQSEWMRETIHKLDHTLQERELRPDSEAA